MANFAKTLIELIDQSARPDWPLATIAILIAAGITASLRYVFG